MTADSLDRSFCKAIRDHDTFIITISVRIPWGWILDRRLLCYNDFCSYSMRLNFRSPILWVILTNRNVKNRQFDGILPEEPYPPCLRMADRVFLAGYPRIICIQCHGMLSFINVIILLLLSRIATEVRVRRRKYISQKNMDNNFLQGLIATKSW